MAENNESSQMFWFAILAIIAIISLVGIVAMTSSDGGYKGMHSKQPVYVNAETGEMLDSQGNVVGDAKKFQDFKR